MAFLTTLLAGFLGGVIGAVSKETVAWIYRRIDRRASELRSSMDLAVDILNELKPLAIEYWSLDRAGDESITEAALVGRLHFCDQLYSQALSENVDLKRELDVSAIGVRKAVTGGQFGSATRKADRTKPVEIEIAVYSMIAKLKAISAQH